MKCVEVVYRNNWRPCTRCDQLLPNSYEMDLFIISYFPWIDPCKKKNLFPSHFLECNPSIIFQICEWILYRSSFRPDVICYNLLIDAYGQKSLYKKAESTYLELIEARCVPTEDTYALLLRAYCTSGLLEKAEAVFAEMRKFGVPPSRVLFLYSCSYYINKHQNQ